MKIAAIDPGTTFSAIVVCEVSESFNPLVLPALLSAELISNDQVLNRLTAGQFPCVLIEEIAPYGSVGWDIIDTARWGGRFQECAGAKITRLIPRKDVKLALCGTTGKITDKVIRDEIIRKYGGKLEAIGKKKTPGPLYDLRADMWQAFALIIAWPDLSSSGFQQR